MRDGSDAVSDWPLLNALLNCASRRDLGVAAPRRRRRHGLLAARRHGDRLRRHAGGGAGASSACCGTTRRPASCATPMRATTSAIDCAKAARARPAESLAGGAPLQWRDHDHEKTRHWSGAPPAQDLGCAGQRLGADLLGQPRLQRGELRRGLHRVVPRMRQRHRDVGLDAAGPRVITTTRSP